MNILTFDIEDWWVYEKYSMESKIHYLPRLNSYLDDILAFLDKKSFQATFFCLGEVAAKYPEVIRKIDSRGHDIGCHSNSHRFLWSCTPQEVEEDTRIAIDTLENIIGKKVTAYRAPAFSITEGNKWVFEILANNGITHDCSIYSAKRSFGGFPELNYQEPFRVNYNGTRIKEFPMSTTKFFGRGIGYSGGGYFRLFPYWKIRSIVQKSNYVMTYFHLKDFDKEQIRQYSDFYGESALSRYFKDYYRLNSNYFKYTKLVSEFDFISVKQADRKISWGDTPNVHL
ncbi:polysaccharide deacetylase family protein [Schleiferiaceae bacterium]|nr:polysaccharide deacetylase family protein [Schleiferiaceae bacterium]